MSKTGNTKDNLVNTALGLFWSKGFNSVGVEDICNQAGINKGSFYHYFPSKTSLAVAALETAGNIVKQQLELVFSKGSSPVKMIDDFSAFLIGFQKMKVKEIGRVCGCPFTSVGMEEATIDRIIAGTAKNKLGLFKDCFHELSTKAAEEGYIKQSQVEMKTSELFACYLGTFVQIRLNNDLEALENMRTVFYDILNINQKGVKK